MKKKLSLFALIMAVLIVSSCEQTLEQRARKDMVSLIKKIADDPNYVEVSNVSPFINSDSIFCCTCRKVTFPRSTFVMTCKSVIYNVV